MAKRKAEVNHSAPEGKRKKRDTFRENGASRANNSSLEKEIQTPEDLRALLSSTQLSVDELINQVAAFKTFLNSIVYLKSEDISQNVSILQKYLSSQIDSNNEDRSQLVPDVITLAHHADEINSENLYSSAITVIALLLKTIASLHQFREIGNSLCRHLLHEDHVPLLQRGMSAAKAKEHLISPCLRLLREIVQFDGGRAAKAVFRQRHVTFQRLEVFLTMHGAMRDEEQKSRKRLSVRSMAISFLLANIRLQSQTAKCYILGRSKLVRSLLSDTGSDSSGLVCGILDTLRRDVAEDTKLPMAVKEQFFDDWTLGRLATLYSYKNDSSEDGRPSVQESLHALLQTLLASKDHGLLLKSESKQSHGAFDQDSSGSDEENSSNRGMANRRKRRKTVISFLKNLRPYASTLQTDLLLSCFQGSPQLIEEYFSDRLAFSFDPKLTTTWIGYSQFILGIIQLPMLEETIRLYLNAGGLSTDLVLNHILPPPLTQKVLTRCFNQSSTLVKFLTARILVAAFVKFIEAREMLQNYTRLSTENPKVSTAEAASTLLNAFCQRLPKFKDVALQLKGCPENAMMLRESLLRLLTHYSTENLSLAMAENFDISTAFSNTLAALNVAGTEENTDGVLLLNLTHVIHIAAKSPSMRWWHKNDSASLTPFTRLLKAAVQKKQAGDEIQVLLKSLMELNYIIWPDALMSGLQILLLSIQDKAVINKDAIYEFLDNCFTRLVKKTVVYTDMLDDLADSAQVNCDKIEPACLPDLILVTFMEQLPYLVARKDDSTTAAVATFLRLCIIFSLLRGVDRSLLERIKDTIKEILVENVNLHEYFGHALDQSIDSDIQQAYKNSIRKSSKDVESRIPPTIASADVETHSEVIIPCEPPRESEDHHGLTSWMHEDIQDAIADSAIGDLILCLCSEHEEIRKQASTNIRNFTRKLEISGYSEWQQVSLLAGELLETADMSFPKEPLPFVAGIFAARLLRVLTDPLHFLYKKVNNFLNKGPQWTVEKLPSYWTDRILMHPPTEDNSHYQEVEWLLDVLTDALRTPQDMDIYRQCQILEKILTLPSSPKLPERCFEQIIDLLFRCTYVDGSTMLITRCGLMSWLTNAVANEDGRLKLKLKILGRRAYESSDRNRVDEWSSETLAPALAQLDSLDITRSN